MPTRTNVTLALAALLAALAFAAVTPSCSTVRGATRAEQMTDDEFATYSRNTAQRVAAVARAAVGEEDLTLEQVGQVAGIMRGLATGALTGTVLDLVGEKLNGYEQLTLVIFLSEIEAELARPDGFLPDRAKQVLIAIADELYAILEG